MAERPELAPHAGITGIKESISAIQHFAKRFITENSCGKRLPSEFSGDRDWGSSFGRDSAAA
jgi:hypothetical protein